ncbi:MAG TPA: Ig-like domain-containing protein [Arsenophonus sp.]
MINISLPTEMMAEAKETMIIPATINKTKYGLKKINWIVPANFITNGGAYRVISPTQLEITLPAYVYKIQGIVTQEYQIIAVGIDNNDNESNRATTIIRVKPSKNVVNDLIIEPNAVLPANDQDRFTTMTVINNEHGQPLAKQVITFHIDGLKQENSQLGAILFNGTHSATNGEKITVTTDNQGKAVIYVTSKVAGEGKITTTMENGNYKNSPIKFSADRNSIHIAKLNVTKDKALSDGKEKNMLYVSVTDKHGNAVENIPVNLTVTGGAVIENGETANINQHRELIIRISSTKAGNNEVTAEINGSEKMQTITFVTGHPSAEKSLLTAQPATIVANGKAVATLQLERKDQQGNSITNNKVTFTISLANSRISSTKESNGVYSTKLTGTMTGETTIDLKVNGNKLNVSQVAKVTKPSVDKSKLMAHPNSIVADGRKSSTITLELKDVNGNSIVNQGVTFSTSLKGSQIGTMTDKGNGIYEAPLVGTKAGQATISVDVNDKPLVGKTVIVTLTADSSNPSTEKSMLVAEPDTIIASI